MAYSYPNITGKEIKRGPFSYQAVAENELSGAFDTLEDCAQTSLSVIVKDEKGEQIATVDLDPASAPYPNYLRAIPRYIQPGNPAPLIDCKYLTAVCKAAAALRPAKEKAAVRAEANGNMQAVYALADDAAAVVMSIRAPDCSRYEQTITGILDAE